SVAVTMAALALYWWAHWMPVELIALAAAGFGLGPIFPALVALTPARAGEAAASRVVGVQIATASAGGSLGPAGIGLGLPGAGPGLLPPCRAAGAAVFTALHLATSLITRDPC